MNRNGSAEQKETGADVGTIAGFPVTSKLANAFFRPKNKFL